MDFLLKPLRKFLKAESAERKLQVGEELAKGSKPSASFFLMISLATIIATFGLLVNNIAVIIGAMLVAPLLMSVIAMAFAIVTGNLNLFSKSLWGTIKGSLLAIVIATFITLLVPVLGLGTEVFARVQPTLFDLIIALASGAAAAYAIAKEDLSESLSGIAVAVAIVPPLAVVGIGLAMKNAAIWTGALLLFLSNLVAINLAAMFIFWVLGFAPKWNLETKETKQKIAVSIILLFVAMVPLSLIMLNTLEDANLNKDVTDVIHGQIAGFSGYDESTSLVDLAYEEKKGALNIHVTIRVAEKVTNIEVSRIEKAIEKKIDKKVGLTLKVIQIDLFEPEDL